MWRVQKRWDGGCVVLAISGRIEGEELAELEQAMRFDETTGLKVELDLQEVKLVDQQVIAFLACCEANGTRLRNCPPYIREWIAREMLEKESQD